MLVIMIDGKVIEQDEDGFLLDFDAWTEEICKDLAKLEGIERLTKDHWQFTRFLREFFKEKNSPPAMRGTFKGAFKLAGLPKSSGLG